MTNLNEMTLEELRTLETEIKVAKVLRKEVEKNLILTEKNDRIEEFKGNVNPNDVITFLYNKNVVEGKIVRCSDKSVTVESDSFVGKEGTRYVSYDKIVSCSSPVVETPVVETETEEIA